MVVQYPHTIIITWQTEPYQDPDTGIFTPGEQQGPYSYQCRAEVNSKAGKIAGNDGAMLDYTFDVFLPKMSIQIPVDADYTLTDDTGTFTGKVKRHRNGQLNSRLWL